MPSFIVQNFGCRASQADGAAIEGLLASQGFDRTRESAGADFVVLNTCTVTSAADDEVRHIVRRVHRENPEARIVVTGCYAQRSPDELAQLPGVALVVGNSHKMAIGDLLRDHDLTAPFHGEVHIGDIAGAREFFATPIEGAPGDRSRPNLKVQDGCSNRCSFCIIPSVRGRSRSAPAAQIIEQVQRLSAEFPEIVLTGINLGRWGRESGFNMRLSDLLQLLLAETDVKRLRLSSVEPMDWSDELLDLVASSPRIAKHMHAPLQSGSDAVLKRMHRKYRSRHYASRLQLAARLMPDAAFGADVMTGFPGETDDEFRETVDFIENLPLTYLHVFPYSERPGTPAAEAADQIPSTVRKERCRFLKALSDRKNLAFRRRFVGHQLSAVTLENSRAISSNYIAFELRSPVPARRLTDLVVGNLTATGVREHNPLTVLV